MALDPLNRRATRRTFISRASKGARRVAAERETDKGREKERRRGEGYKGKREEGRTEGPATMQHMARARPEQHAMQFSCRLHHQSVLARSRVHRARELPGCLLSFSPAPSAPCASYCRSTSFESAPCSRFLLSVLLPFFLPALRFVLSIIPSPSFAL